MITSDDLNKIEQYAFEGGQVDAATVISLCEQLRECQQLRHAQRGPVTGERYELPNSPGMKPP